MANKPILFLPHIVNLANSIIGVSVLALPLCFQKCGALLGIVLILFSAWLSYTSCCFLTRTASYTKRRTYEALAFHFYGQKGKLAVEIGTMGLMLGTLVAFFIILGDLCPFIISHFFNIENSVQLRTTVLLILGLFVIFPLSMKTNLESISKLSMLSLSFYGIFAVHTIFCSIPHLKTWEFVRNAKYWDIDGFFSSLPIFALSYACQIQLFMVYQSVPEVPIKETSSIVKWSVVLSSTIYLSIGYFGYISFYDSILNGDVLMNFSTTHASTLIKLAFCASTIFSFPLCIYPCRNSLSSLLFSNTLHDNLGGHVHPSINATKYMTFGLLAFTLTIGILVPKVEVILGLTGSTLGSLISFLLPSLTYLRTFHQESPMKKLIPNAVLIIGLTISIVSTLATLNISHHHTLVNLEDKAFDSNPMGAIAQLSTVSTVIDISANKPLLLDKNLHKPSNDVVIDQKHPLNPIIPSDSENNAVNNKIKLSENNALNPVKSLDDSQKGSPNKIKNYAKDENNKIYEMDINVVNKDNSITNENVNRKKNIKIDNINKNKRSNQKEIDEKNINVHNDGKFVKDKLKQIQKETIEENDDGDSKRNYLNGVQSLGAANENMKNVKNIRNVNSQIKKNLDTHESKKNDTNDNVKLKINKDEFDIKNIKYDEGDTFNQKKISDHEQNAAINKKDALNRSKISHKDGKRSIEKTEKERKEESLHENEQEKKLKEIEKKLKILEDKINQNEKKQDTKMANDTVAIKDSIKDTLKEKTKKESFFEELPIQRLEQANEVKNVDRDFNIKEDKLNEEAGITPVALEQNESHNDQNISKIHNDET